MSKLVGNLLDKLNNAPSYEEERSGEVALRFMNAFQLQDFMLEVRKQGVKYGLELAKLAAKPECREETQPTLLSEVEQFEVDLTGLLKKYKVHLRVEEITDMPDDEDPSYIALRAIFHSRRFPIEHNLGRGFPR